MNLPQTCPFCGAGVLVMAGGFECRNGRWATFDCRTSIHAGQAERRTQSRTCEDAERAHIAARVASLESENKGLADRFSDADTERNAAQAGLKAAFDRVAELEAREKQRAEDEAWANERTVLVEFHPVTSGWYASAPDGVVGINATAPTIHAALRALREKMEAKP